jgi:predicted 3-demethylubiquinone-9 3-methyltransferase (glyoxalase superfamily)
MTQKIKTFLMFDGKCEEAMTFYVSLFRDAAVTGIRRCFRREEDSRRR